MATKKSGAKAAKQRADHAARERARYASAQVQDERSQWDSKGFDSCWDEALFVDTERDKCRDDFKYFYDTIFSETVRNRRTRQFEQQGLGAIHLLMIDFLHLDLHGVKTYSKLHEYLPPRDERGFFSERWLYWKTLDSEPEIQDGPDGPVSKRFYESFWQGVTIRICGDGFTKCALAPRGHLKSTVGGVCDTAWRLIREPSDRHVIRSSGSTLAKAFLEGIKGQFESNERFMRLWGHMKPEKREGVWNTSQLQIKCKRRGMSPTVHAMGLNTEAVGTHADNYLNDDVVGEKNSLTPQLRAKARQAIQKQQAQREPDSTMTVLGTRWEEDDVYGTFVGQPGVSETSGTMAPESSFFVATVLDGDETVEVSSRLSPLKYGKPIWPEVWNVHTVMSKRIGMPSDRVYFSQYFNQFFGTSNRMFKPHWIQCYPAALRGMHPADVARKLKLNIRIGTDTGSGKPAVDNAKRDDTAACVSGQDPVTKEIYILGGFREKMTLDEIAIAIMDLAEFWYGVAKEYGGDFRIGFEATRWTTALKPALQDEQRKRNVEALFLVEELAHGNKHKSIRIGWLVMPYFHGRVYWPGAEVDCQIVPQLFVPSVKQGHEPYDLMAAAKHEFENYNPHATEDNWLDSAAYSYNMCEQTGWNIKNPAKVYELGQGHRASTPDEMQYYDAPALDMGEAIAL